MMALIFGKEQACFLLEKIRRDLIFFIRVFF